MVNKLIAVALAVCLASPALAAWPGRSGKPYAGRQAVPYTGPGDLLAHQVWYGVRAYSSKTRGSKLMTVCDSDVVANTDTACADIFSSPTTGAIVPITVGGIACPMPAGTTDDWADVGGSGYSRACTIKKAYDLTNHGIDVSQSEPNLRPYLMTNAIPILEVDQGIACMYYPDYLSSLASTATINWALPLTMSAFLINTAPVGSKRVGPMPQFGPSIALRSNSGVPVLSFAPAGQENIDALRLSAGTVANAPALDVSGHALDDTQPYVIDHYPHAVQATFSASGTTSSAYVNGFNYPNLTTGTTAPGPDTVEVGAADTLANHFNGILCEAGFASGDQSARNAAIDANQRAYYTTPTVTPTVVFDQTVDFNTFTPGTRFSWAQQKAAFNKFVAWTDANYTVTSAANSPMCGGGAGYTGVESCVPAFRQAFTIVRDGPNATPTVADPALQLMLIQGSFGFAVNGYGNGQLTFGLGLPGNPVGAPATFNVMDYEYDLMYRDHTTAPNGLDFDFSTTGKQGPVGGFVNVGGGDITTGQPQWYNILGQDTTANYYINIGGDNVLESQRTEGSMGTHTQGVWYHIHEQTALGPNGWTMIWSNDGPGTPMKLRHAVSRASPYRTFEFSPTLTEEIGGMTTPTKALALAKYPFRRWGITPHFGGQGESAAKNDSYLVYDNFHVKGYMR